VFAGVRSRKLKARRKTKKLATTSALQNGTGNKQNLLHDSMIDAWERGARLALSCDSFATEIRPLALLTRPEGHGFNPFEDARRRLSLKEI
jgi:hypothetical protein